MKTFAGIALLILCGCGGSESTNPVGHSLNPAMAGTWTGTTTVAIPGTTPFYYAAQLVVSVSGDQGTVSRICSDGSGGVTASGSGDSLLWSGSLTCPASPFAGCSSVVATFTSANLHYAAGALTAQGSATLAGCGATTVATFSFTGSK